jgi:hypothetical protein
MSAAAPLPLILPNLAEPWYAKPFRFATLPKAAEKVWACIKFESYRRRSGTITITDRFGAQWCSAHLGVHVGRRCFQKGLKQLEDIGAIVRHRSHGGRVITITVHLAGPKPKTRPKAPASKGQPAPAPTAAAPTAPATATPPEPDAPPASPEECRQAAATLRALVAQIHAQEQEQAADPPDQVEPPPPAPAPRSSPRRPRLAIPDSIRREIEEKERRRRADERARLRAIPDEQRSDDQRRRLNGLVAELDEPGAPPTPSGP